MTESYHCSHCRASDDRTYRVQFFLQTCPDCGEHGQFVHEAVVDVLDQIPERDRPGEWPEMTLAERLVYATRHGLVEFGQTRTE